MSELGNVKPFSAYLATGKPRNPYGASDNPAPIGDSIPGGSPIEEEVHLPVENEDETGVNDIPEEDPVPGEEGGILPGEGGSDEPGPDPQGDHEKTRDAADALGRSGGLS